MLMAVCVASKDDLAIMVGDVVADAALRMHAGREMLTHRHGKIAHDLPTFIALGRT